jgi:hypothetical protein
MLYFSSTFTQHVSAICWKPIRCDHCGHEWHVRLDISSTGSGTSAYMIDQIGAQRRARSSALLAASRAYDGAICKSPCPSCGRYQSRMVAWLRAQKGCGLLALGGSLLSVAGFLVFVTLIGHPFMDMQLFVGVCTAGAVLLVGGLAAWLGMQRVRRRYDPQTDPAVRARHPVQTARPSAEDHVGPPGGWESVTCANCRREWAYLVDTQELVWGVRPKQPCPHCEHYQPRMVTWLAHQRYFWLFAVGVVGLGLSAIVALIATLIALLEPVGLLFLKVALFGGVSVSLAVGALIVRWREVRSFAPHTDAATRRRYSARPENIQLPKAA